MAREERARLVPAMRERIAAFRDEQFGDSITEIFEDPSRSYPAPEVLPAALPHPRVMLTREMLPGIKAAFDSPECAAAVAAYRKLLENDSDGTLPAPYLHETGRKGEHNFDYELLAVLEARALEYLLTGEEYFGYSAILGIMNYLSTLDIQWIPCDACREYGSAMYYTALVYDWCYDLLTEDDKRRITAGVEHRLCRGTVGIPEKAAAGGVKFEVGFPPTRQGAVTGHGSETQLLRDYVAFSIAIANEHPGWWSYIGARMENEFIPARTVFYAAGMYPQGMSCYAPARFPSDLWSACLLSPIYGRNPYPEADMKRVVRTMLANETVDGSAFSTGDGYRTTLSPSIGISAILAAHLFHDRTARAAAFYFKIGATEFPITHSTAITPTIFLFASQSGITAAADRREGIPLIHKARGYANEYIVRDGWQSDAAVVLMKAGGRYTANHEHSCAGNFQIWYKGYLTGDTGLYQGYGSPQHGQFHVRSIAHNVPLIFNPAYHDPEPTLSEAGKQTNAERYWYSGGQRRAGEAPNVDAWHDNRYISAETPVMQSEAGDGKPIYAYVSTNITRAYEPDTVAFLNRAMITSYRTDGSTPMTLFVFDRIESVDPSFKKTFLLQINGEAAPEVSGCTVTTVNGEGKLSLTAVTESSITPLGGEGQNYLVNGVQCAAPRTPGKTWGRVEISPIGERKTDHMLNVLTVGDRDAEAPTVTRIDCGKECEGAYVAGNAAIFRKSREDLGSDIPFTLPAPAYTYFSGLNEGEFAVLSGGKPVAILTVGENQNLAAATLPAGKLLLKKL